MQEDSIPLKYPALFADCFDFSPPAGWLPIVERLSERLSADPLIRCAQVKSKFGGLRYYIEEHQPEWALDAIRAAEREASTTCESCGASGAKLRGHGWVETLCDGCVR